MSRRVSILCIALPVFASVAWGQVEAARAPITWVKPAQDKNFYLLSLIERDAAVKKAFLADVTLRRIGDAKRQAVAKAVTSCEATAACYVDALRFSDDEIAETDRAVSALFTGNADLRKLVFMPMCHRKWKESTRMTTEPRMMFHLVPAFGAQLLRTITRDQMQLFLDKKAENLSRSVVDHLRWDLNSIFKTALSDGLVDSNPAAALFTPAGKPEGEKRVMSPEEIRLALSVLDTRARLIFRMAVFDGMRPGEILAIQLGKISEHSVLIDKRVYKGDVDTPKGRKGKRTSRTVGLSPGTVTDLKVWQTLLLKVGPEAYLFPSERETPLRRDNVWKRDMHPALKKVGLGWATFQVLRRTNASLSRKAKIDDKVAADQRGHGLGVSLEVYSISGVQQKIDAAKRLESEVIQ